MCLVSPFSFLTNVQLLMYLLILQPIRVFMAPDVMNNTFKSRLTQAEWTILGQIRDVLEVRHLFLYIQLPTNYDLLVPVACICIASRNVC